MLGIPLLLWLVLPPRAIPGVVFAMTVICYFIARRVDHYYAQTRGEGAMGERHAWNWHAVNRANLLPMFVRFGICAMLLLLYTYIVKPDMLFSFVLAKPQVWAVVMLVYPLVSVVPQEIIFRRYMFVRFADLLKPAWVMIAVSGIGFGFAHIIFNNWMAPLLCVAGGLIFAHTYHKTRSLALVCIEHALYGDLIFTLGLGRYFYHGAIGH